MRSVIILCVLLTQIAFAHAPRAVTAILACTPVQVAANLGATNNGAGHAQTTIALVNHSNRACALTAYPGLTFEQNGNPVKVTVTKYAPTKPATITVAPGHSAAMAFVWPVLDTGGKPCAQFADAWIGLPGGGPPLWVPTHTAVCLDIEQSPLTAPAPSGKALPSIYDASVHFDDWMQQQECAPRLAQLAKITKATPLRIVDSLDLTLKDGTDFSGAEPPGAIEHTEMATLAPAVFFDPSQAVVATTFVWPDPPSNTIRICGLIHSVPYGIATGTLTGVRTTRGVRLGSWLSTVQTLDGHARVIPLDDGYSAVHYAGRSVKVPAGEFDPLARIAKANLTFLFYQSRVIAIEYEASRT